MTAVTKRCSICREEVAVEMDKTAPPDRFLRLDQGEIACAACVRKLGQNPENRYIVLLGAYYEKVANIYAKVGPVGAFHG
ncbi:MAG: hypothetical protein ABIN58_11975 [candidate division WOR-3 bacterium]